MKKIISFAIRNIPRKYLQYFSHIVLKVVSIFFKGNNVHCPICKSNFRKFLPYGRNSRDNALCPSCLALERHRLMWLYLENKTEFFSKNIKLLHVAPEICFIDRFEAQHNIEYITADIESPLAKVKMDLHAIPFEDNTFDVIFCNHVLEHVADDIQCLKEMHRVMKPGGWGILQIPIFHPLKEKTYEDASITDPKEREKVFGQNDHVRMYGKDYGQRLAKGGFEVVEENYIDSIPADQQALYALPTGEIIFRVEKKLPVSSL